MKAFQIYRTQKKYKILTMYRLESWAYILSEPISILPREKIAKEDINTTIFNHPEFEAFSAEMDKVFSTWKKNTTKLLKSLDKDFKPRQIITTISEDLLKSYSNESRQWQWLMIEN